MFVPILYLLMGHNFVSMRLLNYIIQEGNYSKQIEDIETYLKLTSYKQKNLYYQDLQSLSDLKKIN